MPLGYTFQDSVVVDPLLAIHGASSAVVKATNNFAYAIQDRIITKTAADMPALPSTTIATGKTGVYTLSGDYNGNLAWTTGTTVTTPTVYNFTFSGVTVIPAAGSVYTNNSQTFTVLSVTYAGSAGALTGVIAATGTGAPASSGTLTESTTSTYAPGDATISFSAYSTSSYIPYSVLPNMPAYALTNNPQVLYVPRPIEENDMFATSQDVCFLGAVIIQNATGSTFTGGTTDLDTPSLTVYYTNRQVFAY